MSNKTVYQEIFNVFVKLGFTSFGGPPARLETFLMRDT